jgi:Delta7-sterol 5-desaturase
LDSLFYFLDTDFWQHLDLVVAFTVTIFAIVLVRYALTALSYDFFITRILKITFKNPGKVQIRKEVIWSVISSGIFAVLSVATFLLFQKGYTKIYTEITARSTGYFIFSIATFLLLYETYYYWLHRWMHHPRIFKIVHKVHHQSLSPTVFTSFSFHPFEAVLQFIFFPIVIMIIPIHYYALGTVLMIMTVSAVINHAGVEIFPKAFINHPVGKWLIGSTHHDLHHKEFKTNFGLYLTFWDKWMKTENPKFEQQFELNKNLLSQSQSPHRPSADDQRR